MDLKMDLKNRFRASILKTSIAAQERLCKNLRSLPYREVDPDTNDLVALFKFLSSEELEDVRLSEFKVKYPLLDLNLIHERLKKSPELWKKKEKLDLEEEKRELEEVKRKLKEYEQQWMIDEQRWLEEERIWELEMERENLEMSKSKQLLLEERRIWKLEAERGDLEMSNSMERIRKLQLEYDEGNLEMSKSMEKSRKLELEYDEMKENYRRNAGKESDGGTDGRAFGFGVGRKHPEIGVVGKDAEIRV